MQVVLDDKKIDVIIEHKQNKNLYIRVTDNLELLVKIIKLYNNQYQIISNQMV